MKIVHLATLAPYNEGWGYQENLLPKYQVRLGHEVTLITSVFQNSKSGMQKEIGEEDYYSPDGFRVIRLRKKKILGTKITEILSLYPVYDFLCKIRPDFIMIHGLGNITQLQVKKYVKKIHPDCVVVADSHLDVDNLPMIASACLRHRFLRFVWRRVTRVMNPLYAAVYGVTPMRARVARDVFGVQEEKLGVLPAGADDEKIEFEKREEISEEIRKKHGIEADDFLIVTGGKIDRKKNIHVLMEAVTKLCSEKVKLIVFGDPDEEMRNRFESLAEHPCIRAIGWISSDETYRYFLAADLVVFPGLHSVMWEQACACGAPCVFHKLEGIDHVDVGGNCIFALDISAEGLLRVLEQVIKTDLNQQLKAVSRSPKTTVFLYSRLAKKAIECAQGRFPEGREEK